MNSFWQYLKKPFFVMAPLADVTDSAFRIIVAKYGKPDVVWTEFVSADGLAHPDARERLCRDLEYGESERPIVAQLFGSNTENMRYAAELCAGLGFDGIDINMGCPDRGIEKQGAGAAHIKNISNACEIIRAAKDGAQRDGVSVPVSVKTRVGYHKDQIDEWIPALLETGISALTIHARTRDEMSKAPARWGDVKRVVKIRDDMRADTLIIGNGDIEDIDDARNKIEESGADGAMLGRAIFGTPWLFSKNTQEMSAEDILRIMVEHTKLFEEKLGDIKNFAVMKKHYKAYTEGIPNSKRLRVALIGTGNSIEVESVVRLFLNGCLDGNE